MTQTVDARKIAELQRLYADERSKRIDLERKLAGTRSAVLKLQASLAKRKADEAERRANGAC
jgi:hypothetical protein